MIRCDMSYERHELWRLGQMARSTGRLRLASDIQSVARLGGRCGPKTLEAPAATLVAVPVCEARTRGLTTLTALTNEGAAVAKSTWGVPGSDSETRDSAVKITPASSDPATVPTTHTSA